MNREIDISEAGKVVFAGQQQQWKGEVHEQSARFAGQEMMACRNDGVFHLHYMCFQTGGFRTIEGAKAAAPDFARTVLARLSTMISDHRTTSLTLLAGERKWHANQTGVVRAIVASTQASNQTQQTVVPMSILKKEMNDGERLPRDLKKFVFSLAEPNGSVTVLDSFEYDVVVAGTRVLQFRLKPTFVAWLNGVAKHNEIPVF